MLAYGNALAHEDYPTQAKEAWVGHPSCLGVRRSCRVKSILVCAFVLPLVCLESPERSVAGIGETFPLLVVVECSMPSLRAVEAAQLCYLSAIIISQLFTRTANLDFYSRFRIVFGFGLHSSALNVEVH
jgi:hypothetical protein